MLNCPLRANLNRSCLRWIHSSTSWDHVHSIQFILHFRRGLSSFFRDRFHKQHQTVKVLENRTHAQNLISDEGQEKFRKGCFYVSSLQQKLTFDVNLLRSIQFLNPVKRTAGGATSAISNLDLKVLSVLENVLGSIFQMELKHAGVDAIRNQWYFFQNEEIPEEW